MKRVLKMILEYDGTGFSGWQIQPEVRTVQGEVERAIRRFFQEDIRVAAAGRTDAGVHAMGQVVSFPCSVDLEAARIARGLNALLPRDIRILEVSEEPEDFNARHKAVSRWYRYVLSRRSRAVGRQYAWAPRYRFDLPVMRRASQHLAGEHDFTAFSKRSETIDDYRSTVTRIEWTENEDLIQFDICAIRFFHNMIRIIMGTLVEIGRGRIPEEDLKTILMSGDRRKAGPTAPAHGLFFMGAEYE